MRRLIKIISGGQIGVDLAALRAAKNCNLQTGGYMPKGYRQIGGRMPQDDVEYFAMTELDDARYPVRTYRNVAESDATLRIAIDWNSRGELCTLRALRAARMPYADVTIFDGRGCEPGADEAVAQWLVCQDVRTLNVAGNARPELEEYVQFWLQCVFVRYDQILTEALN